MTRKELVKQLTASIKPNTQMCFYARYKNGNGNYEILELKLDDICMTADVDVPNIGGMLFEARRV